MHDSLTIANRFLDVAAASGDPLTPMQLLKLVYIAHGWMLGLYGVPLIRDDVQAWKYGPVIPRVYHAVKDYRNQPVYGPLPQNRNDTLVPAEESLIRQIFDIYGHRSGVELSRLTHQPGSPWAQTYLDGMPNLVISNDIIEDHYRALSHEARRQPS